MTVRVCFAVMLIGGWLSAVSAAEWPQFRGPEGDGIAPSGKPPIIWSETENIRWKVETPGRGWSSPVIADRRIWLTAAIERKLTDELREKLKSDKLAGNPMKDQMTVVGEISLRLLAFEEETGKEFRDRELFAVELPQSVHQLNSYASPTPVWDHGRLYCYFGTYGTVCYDIAADEIVWQTALPLEHGVGPGSSPVVVGTKMIIPCDGVDQQYVVALDTKSGEVAWKKSRPKMNGENGDLHKSFSTPLVINAAGREQVVIVGAQWVVSYDPETGEEIWKVRHGDGFSNVPRPVFGRGIVYIATGFMKPEMWAIQTDGEGDVSETHVTWKVPKQVPTMPSPVLVDSELYFVNDQGVASCVDAITGKQRWQKRIEGNYIASPLFVNGYVYFCNREGKTLVVKAGKTYEPVAENHLDGQIFASPAVLGDALILRTDTHLYRIEE